MKEGFNKYLVMIVGTLLLTSFLMTVATVTGDEADQYENSRKIDPALQEADGVIKLRVILYQDADVKGVVGQLRNMGAEIYQINTESVIFINCIIDSSELEHIASIPEVEWMQQVFEPQTLMNNISSNTYMGHDTPQVGGFAGNGVLAEVQDNGCDADIVAGAGNGHSDLSNIIYTDGGAIVNDHGTCVSGIMFGTGAGDPNAEGILPQGTGAFAQWNTGNALTIANLWNGNFNEGSAGMNGIAQTNSWWSGAVMSAQYDSYSNEIDQAAVDYPHVLNHWACGNSNFGVGPSTMSTESVSKNDISGGAIFHMDTAVLSDDDWHNNGAGSTPSQGPAADGRQKPDLCGPFDWIYTTDEEPGGYVGGDYYNNFGGTSGATPNVAGSSCLVYDMYQDNYFDNNPAGDWPYSCTVKAMMIANAYQYPIGVNGIYRGVEGWGTPDLEYMYNLGAEYHVIEEYPQAMNAGDSWSRGVYSDGTNPLKITLCWIDPAAPSSTGTGRALINNLNLRVVSPGGTVYWGNNGLYADIWSASGTGANNWYDGGAPGANYCDNLNNVENVFIQTPTSGVWTIEVTGQVGDIGSGPQDFSMIASGAQGISSLGTIALDRGIYVLEDIATVTVSDLDLNVLPGVAETVDVNVDSTTEPAGELLTLTETGPDTSTFENTITLSATDGAGILHVSHADTITATYNDADDGTGSPAVVTDSALVDGDPPEPPTALTVEWWGSSVQVVYSEDFEGDGTPTFAELGWTTGGGSNDWEIGTPGGLGGEYGNPDPVGAVSGSFSIGNDLTGLGATLGDYEANLGVDSNYVYSPAIDCSAATSTMLYFERHLNVEQPLYDHSYIEISTNGASWNQVWTNTATITDSAWNQQSYDISTWADNQATVYVRFELGNSDGGWQYSGWNIDDLYVEGLVTGGTNDNCLNWTLSLDDGAGDNDVALYNIYRANNEFGPWDITAYIDSVPAGADQYVDLARGEFDGINWWYVVRAEDAVGNEDMNTNAVPEIPPGNVPPSIPTNPVPADTAVGIGLNPTLSVDVADPNGDAMDVSFFDASGPTLIGTDFGVPSSSTASVPWNGLSADTTYNWYAEAYDGEFTTQSATWQFTTMDTTPPAPPTGLTVEWWGNPSTTWIDEDFAGGVPPAGWNIYTSGITGTWTQQPTANAGGTSPEARFDYGASGIGTSIIYAGPFDTTGLTTMDLQWQNMIDDYAAGTGVMCKIQTSSDAVSWTDTSWVWDDTVTPGDMPAALESIVLNTADVGSSTFYLGWTVDGNSYQLNYWYIDDVLLTSTGGGSTDDNWLNWTLSADDGAGANDVDHYNIYRSDVSTGPWNIVHLIDSVPAGTDTYMDLGRGEPDGINWWYVVRAEDIWGNLELNVDSVPEIPTGDTPPTVTVLAPNGAEVFAGGGSTAITWTATPGTNPLLADPITIEYSSSGLGGPWNPVASNEANDGTYTWNPIPLIDSTNCYVRVTVEDTIGLTDTDESDGPFEIDSTAPAAATNVHAELTGANDVTILWTSSISMDVDRYEVYFITNGWDPTGASYAFLADAGLGTSYLHNNAGINNVNAYFYQLRTYDIAGHETRTIFQAGKTSTALETVVSPTGWFMLGSPLVQSDTSLGHVIQGQGLPANFDYAQAYDAFDAADPWKSFMPSRPINDLTDITNNQGFWMHVTANSRWCTAGYVRDMAIPMKAGWNLVTYPYALAQRTTAQIDTDLVANCPGYDDMRIFDPIDPYRLNTPTGAEIIQQGYGLWVHVNADTTWMVLNY